MVSYPSGTWTVAGKQVVGGSKYTVAGYPLVSSGQVEAHAKQLGLEPTGAGTIPKPSPPKNARQILTEARAEYGPTADIENVYRVARPDYKLLSEERSLNRSRILVTTGPTFGGLNASGVTSQNPLGISQGTIIKPFKGSVRNVYSMSTDSKVERPRVLKLEETIAPNFPWANRTPPTVKERFKSQVAYYGGVGNFLYQSANSAVQSGVKAFADLTYLPFNVAKVAQNYLPGPQKGKGYLPSDVEKVYSGGSVLALGFMPTKLFVPVMGYFTTQSAVQTFKTPSPQNLGTLGLNVGASALIFGPKVVRGVRETYPIVKYGYKLAKYEIGKKSITGIFNKASYTYNTITRGLNSFYEPRMGLQPNTRPTLKEDYITIKYGIKTGLAKAKALKKTGRLAKVLYVYGEVKSRLKSAYAPKPTEFDGGRFMTSTEIFQEAKNIRMGKGLTFKQKYLSAKPRSDWFRTDSQSESGGEGNSLENKIGINLGKSQMAGIKKGGLGTSVINPSGVNLGRQKLILLQEETQQVNPQAMREVQGSRNLQAYNQKFVPRSSLTLTSAWSLPTQRLSFPWLSAFKTSQVLGSKTVLGSRTVQGSNTIQSQILKNKLAVLISQKLGVSTVGLTKQKLKSNVLTVLGTKQVLVTEQIITPRVDQILVPQLTQKYILKRTDKNKIEDKIPPPSFGFGGSLFMTRKKSGSDSGKAFKGAYLPSLTAVGLNIYGKKPSLPDIRSGMVLRPLVV